MRDSNRIKPLLKLIEKMWCEYPDQRLCQLLRNVANCNDWYSNDLFYLEDNKLEKALKNYEVNKK